MRCSWSPTKSRVSPTMPFPHIRPELAVVAELVPQMGPRRRLIARLAELNSQAGAGAAAAAAKAAAAAPSHHHHAAAAAPAHSHHSAHHHGGGGGGGHHAAAGAASDSVHGHPPLWSPA